MLEHQWQGSGRIDLTPKIVTASFRFKQLNIPLQSLQMSLLIVDLGLIDELFPVLEAEVQKSLSDGLILHQLHNQVVIKLYLFNDREKLIIDRPIFRQILFQPALEEPDDIFDHIFGVLDFMVLYFFLVGLEYGIFFIILCFFEGKGFFI